MDKKLGFDGVSLHPFEGFNARHFSGKSLPDPPHSSVVGRGNRSAAWPCCSVATRNVCKGLFLCLQRVAETCCHTSESSLPPARCKGAAARVRKGCRQAAGSGYLVASGPIALTLPPVVLPDGVAGGHSCLVRACVDRPRTGGLE